MTITDDLVSLFSLCSCKRYSKHQKTYATRRHEVKVQVNITQYEFNTSVPLRVISRVKKTAGNRTGYRGYRSNRPGPVPVPAGSNRAQIQILNLNSKKWKNSKKNLKNTSSCDEFNDVKFFQIFVHLVYFASI